MKIFKLKIFIASEDKYLNYKVHTNKSCKIPLTFSIVGITSIACSSGKPPSPSEDTFDARVCRTFARVSLKCCFRAER